MRRRSNVDRLQAALPLSRSPRIANLEPAEGKFVVAGESPRYSPSSDAKSRSAHDPL
jgi:hypothetical protein